LLADFPNELSVRGSFYHFTNNGFKDADLVEQAELSKMSSTRNVTTQLPLPFSRH
jgi:hypothetical protein